MRKRVPKYVLCILICLTCILMLMPRQTEKFNYEYEVNQPWRYEQMIAKFAFPIYKSESQLKHERDSALRELTPYFNTSQSIGTQELSNFRSDYSNGQFAHIPYCYINHVSKHLEEVYQNGIIALDDISRLQKYDTKNIRIVSGNAGSLTPVSQLFTTRTAYEYLMTADSEGLSHDILMKMNLNEYLEPNLIYDSLKTNAARNEVFSQLSKADGMVLAGELIIDRGERVTPRQKAILDSMKYEVETNHTDISANRLVMLGKGGMVVIIFVFLLLYLQLFRRDLFEKPNSIYLIFSTIAFFCLLSEVLLRFKVFSVYMIPFAMVPIFIRVFMDTRTAFMVHMSMLLICSLSLTTNYQFLMIESIGGLAAIYSLRDLTERSQLFRTAGIVTLSMWVAGFFFDLSQGMTFDVLDRRWYFYIAINGIALISTYPMLYVIERLFGFTSTVTLIELSNTNSPILRRMSKEAQGTFIHSMQVGNLAAEVADKIGAKAQLVRTGALYHDIGKMLNTAFFTENQSDVNPHDSLPEERSAEIIINHVTEGLRLAEKFYLPKVIRDFILTHHGNGLVRYFYVKSCNKHGEENVDKRIFTYPGKNPFTREQAILMMADSVEAASRSLTEYSEESISTLVNRIIDGQVAAGNFTECPITFRDIADAKRVFADSLKTIYHTRIAYPEMNKGEQSVQRTNTAPSRRLFGTNTWTWNKKN